MANKDRSNRVYYRAASLIELMVTLVLAALLLTVASPLYNWAFDEKDSKLAKIAALTFERNVRSTGNINLSLATQSEIDSIIDTLEGNTEGVSVTKVGSNFEVKHGNSIYCVELGEEVGASGNIIESNC